jgi:Keratinocyte-associated gene product
MKPHSRLQYSICVTLCCFLLSSFTFAAPTTTQNLLEKIYADTKFNTTLESWDLSECGGQGTPLCVILYDTLLTLAAAKIPLTAEELQPQMDKLKMDTFCTDFVATVPSTSKFEATKARIELFAGKKLSICSTCTVYSVDMTEAVKPICGLIYLGYKKAAAAPPPPVNENKSVGGDTVIRPVAASLDASVPEEVKKPNEGKVDLVENFAHHSIADFRFVTAPPVIPAEEVPETLPQAVEAPKNKTMTPASTPKVVNPQELKPIVDAEKPKETTKPAAVNVTANEPVKPAPSDVDEREEQNSININEVNNEEDPSAGLEDGGDDEDPEGAIDSGEEIPQDINPPVEVPPKPRQDSASYANVDDAGPKVVQITDPFFEETESNFFGYFLFLMLVCIVAYVVYHNKSKILALLLEGRRANGGRGGSRRKHTAAYRKLDSNLEEAITSNTIGEARTAQIIY